MKEFFVTVVAICALVIVIALISTPLQNDAKDCASKGGSLIHVRPQGLVCAKLEVIK